jgi:hypothetical protein
MLKRFHFERNKDVSGTSGCGIVAEGVIFTNGHVALTWLSDHPSINLYDSIEDVELIHGHQGCTHIVYDDPPVPESGKKETGSNRNGN